MDIFSLLPPKEIEERKYTIAITNLEKSNLVSTMTEQNNKSTFFLPGYWESPRSIEKLKEFLE